MGFSSSPCLEGFTPVTAPEGSSPKPEACFSSQPQASAGGFTSLASLRHKPYRGSDEIALGTRKPH